MKGRRICVWIFAVYCALMVWLLFGRVQYAPSQVVENVNPMPLETIQRFLRVLMGDFSADMKRHAVVNLVGNVVMFVPLGFFHISALAEVPPFVAVRADGWRHDCVRRGDPAADPGGKL